LKWGSWGGVQGLIGGLRAVVGGGFREKGRKEVVLKKRRFISKILKKFPKGPRRGSNLRGGKLP